MKLLKNKMINLSNKFNELYSEKIKDISFLRQLLFFIPFVLIMFVNSMNASYVLRLEKINMEHICIISSGLLIIKIMVTKETFFKYIYFLFIIIFAHICDKTINTDNIFFTSILLIIAARGIDVKKIVKCVFIIQFSFLIYSIGIFLLEYTGILSVDLKQTLFYRGEQLRYNFYFYHPNTFSNYLFWTYMMYIYLNFDNKKKYKYIVLIAIICAIIVFIFPNSRNCSIFFIISIILLALFKSKKFKNSKVFKTLPFFFFICLFISFLSIILLKNFEWTPIQKIDTILSGRIKIGVDLLEEYGISIFGNLMTSKRNYAAIGVTRLVLDNWYYYMLIRCGVIFSIFYCFSFSVALFKCVQKKYYDKLYAMIIFLAYNLIESVGISINLSFPLFFVGLFL